MPSKIKKCIFVIAVLASAFGLSIFILQKYSFGNQIDLGDGVVLHFKGVVPSKDSILVGSSIGRLACQWGLSDQSRVFNWFPSLRPIPITWRTPNKPDPDSFNLHFSYTFSEGRSRVKSVGLGISDVNGTEVILDARNYDHWRAVRIEVFDAADKRLSNKINHMVLNDFFCNYRFSSQKTGKLKVKFSKEEKYSGKWEDLREIFIEVPKS